ncbi:MAG TPA: TIGR00730 family Rossman fold protein [Bacteroidia bacterium]|jgi:uncharacterized protein (TIGR00730 family)
MADVEPKTDITPHKEERVFLDGPQSRLSELFFMFKVVRDFIHGFRKFHFLGPCATVFGSARFKEDHEYYTMARKVGSELVRMGFTVMTGGGPGIMEAANRGAREAGGRSVGCNIILPKEQDPNPFLDQWVNIDYFFVRKVLLSKYSYAFIVMPGGYGTLDEFFEALTLVQTRKMKNFPVVLMGKKYHKELYDYLLTLKDAKTISEEDLDLFLFTDDIKQAMDFIEENAIKKFNLSKRTAPRPRILLGERRG